MRRVIIIQYNKKDLIVDSRNILFDFKIGNNLNGKITLYSDYMGCRFYEMINDNGELVVDDSRCFDINNKEIVDDYELIYDSLEDFYTVRLEFDRQANEFLNKTKFLKKQNFLIRCQKDDVLIDLEADALNNKIPFAKRLRTAIKDSFKYNEKNARLTELEKHYSPYMIMSYKELITHGKNDPFTLMVEGASLYKLILFIARNPSRWEYQDGYLYVPSYKFIEQAAPYKFSIDVIGGRITEECYRPGVTDLSFIEYLEEKQVIFKDQPHEYSHPLMSNSNKSVKIDLAALKLLVNKQILYIDPDVVSDGERIVNNFLFLADAKQKGYSNDIPPYFHSEDYDEYYGSGQEVLDKYVDKNFYKWELF